MIKIEELMARLKFDDQGLLPVVVQSAVDERVLMVAWTNLDALRQSVLLGETVFYSRSRAELWHKGATSGNTQKIKSIEVDCDADTLLYRVLENGPACHNGTHSCFDTDEVQLNG
jgi:phosphoribosyl-AMP cyclohydrolase